MRSQARAAVFSLSISILGGALSEFGNVSVKRSCDGVGTAGICVSRLCFDVPGELYAPRAAETKVTGADGLPSYYIDKRSRKKGVTSVTCLDRLAFADADFPWEDFTDYGENSKIPVSSVLEKIKLAVGFKGITGVPSWLAEIPGEKLQATCSEVLSFIAECCCGFWYMTADDTCAFAVFGSFTSTMSVNKHTALDIGIEYSPCGIICTDGSGNQFSRGTVGYSYDTLRIESDLITDKGCEEIWGRINGKTYTQYSCDKCILPSVPYPAVRITYAQGYELITQDISCQITKNGIFGALGGNAPGDSEIGSRHRFTRNNVAYGKQSGNILYTKYQGIMVLDDDEE